MLKCWLLLFKWAGDKWKFRCHCGTKVAPATRAVMMTSSSCHWRSDGHTGWLERQLNEGVFVVFKTLWSCITAREHLKCCSVALACDADALFDTSLWMLILQITVVTVQNLLQLQLICTFSSKRSDPTENGRIRVSNPTK